MSLPVNDSEPENTSNWYCYILRNNYEDHKNRTYNGMTNNYKKRIRQHNQEIVGGAKYTHSFGNKSWNYMALVSGLPNKINALQMEWRIKHPDNKRKRSAKYSNPNGRIIGLFEVLILEKWTSKSTILNNTMNLTVYVHSDFKDIVDKFKDTVPTNINIIMFDSTSFDELVKSSTKILIK